MSLPALRVSQGAPQRAALQRPGRGRAAGLAGSRHHSPCSSMHAHRHPNAACTHPFQCCLSFRGHCQLVGINVAALLRPAPRASRAHVPGQRGWPLCMTGRDPLPTTQHNPLHARTCLIASQALQAHAEVLSGRRPATQAGEHLVCRTHLRTAACGRPCTIPVSSNTPARFSIAH
jgi:hypothetical protein